MTRPPLLMRRLTAAQWQFLDAGLAVIVMCVCLYAAAEPLDPATSGWREPGWATALAGIALGAPIVIRRSRPVAATALSLAAAGICLVSGVIPDYASAAPIVAAGVVLYTVGASLTRRRSLVIALLSVVVFAEVLVLAADSPFDPGAGQGAAFAAVILGLSWALGFTVRERRAYAAQLHRQATARAVDEERLRIAREMHDIVAHSMSLIAVKATIANHVADERPQEVRDALRIIEATSRTALTELRRTLGALRTDPDTGPDRSPAPGVADLPSLVEAATSAGIEVQLDVRGVADLPEGVGLAVFRIVQEALTNVVRHAGATQCRVTVAGAPDAVVIEVVDDGRGGAECVSGSTAGGQPDGSGAGGRAGGDGWDGSEAGGRHGGDGWDGYGAGGRHGGEGRDGSEACGRGQGLIGMRERVALYGGELRAAPEPAGGWAVRARLDTGA